MTATMDKLKEVRRIVEMKYLHRGQIHSVGIGLKEVNGQLTDEPCVQVLTGKKLPTAELKAQNIPILPAEIRGVKIDVVEEEQPQILTLLTSEIYSQASNRLQECFDCPIPGGAQIAPVGANWVGTLGCLLRLPRDIYVADTNYHVAVASKFNIDHRLVQPIQGADYFGKLLRYPDIKFNDPQANNLLDYAIIDVKRTDGKYAPVTYTVGTEQYVIGSFDMTVKSPALGDKVQKVGRTTERTQGMCVGIDYTVTVGYGELGTARFINQLIVRGDSGDFSGPGDSGSTILTQNSPQLWGKLFAGGGGRTIANPYQVCLDWVNSVL